jgi:hypothetical protein
MEHLIGEGARFADELRIGDEIREAEIGEAGLGGAEDVAGAAEA